MIDKRYLRSINLNGDKTTLAATTMTYIIYKSNFGKDLLQDILAYNRQNAKNLNLISGLESINNITEEEYNKLSETEQQELWSRLDAVTNIEIDSEFVINIIACMILSAEYPAKRDINEVIQNIPISLIQNKEVGELMQLLIPNADNSQKKTAITKRRK